MIDINDNELVLVIIDNISISIEKDLFYHFKYDLNQDVTFIQDPNIFDFFPLLNKKKNLSDPTMNLISKISFALSKETKIEWKKDIISRIYDFIQGKITKEDKIVFKNNFRSLDITEVASWVKSFGLLALLLEGDVIDKDSILILNFPENFLNPYFQIVYAQIIMELIYNGVKVVIFSSSPFLIKALQKYSNFFENLKDNVTLFIANEKIQQIFPEDIPEILSDFLMPLAELK